MKQEVIASADAPTPVGPYSQAIRYGNLLFCSGQIPIDPATARLIERADVESQTHQVLHNLGAILAAAGVGFTAVVKTTIYLVDMRDFPKVNEVYQGYFGESAPARSTVAVQALPLGARIEIECVAVV